jgi:hypothetical protein
MCEISHIFAIIKKTNIGKNSLVKKKIKTKGRIRIRLLVLNATISITCTVYCSSRMIQIYICTCDPLLPLKFNFCLFHDIAKILLKVVLNIINLQEDKILCCRYRIQCFFFYCCLHQFDYYNIQYK